MVDRSSILISSRVVQTDEEIDEDTVKEETHAASDLLVELQSQIEPGRIADIEVKARSILSGLGFPKGNLEKSVSTLSGGWKMRTNLASVLLQPTDILILDEFTYPLHFGWIDTQEVLDWLVANKPPMMHIIITGREAPQSLIDFADLVTEMREIKHPFNEQGIRAQAGIEF